VVMAAVIQVASTATMTMSSANSTVSTSIGEAG
jgi:hypothetical protein